ncbi:MAG: nuclear transport factor 2 family protein [Dehalococcoidia bacterium]|nr:nuclear transport factor 2 family protein [Dehalococcoidia bacterium]
MTYTPTEQANIDAIYRFMEAEAAQDWDTVYQFIACEAVNYGPGGVVTRGHDEMHRTDAALFGRVAEWRRSVLDIAADGDTVVFRWRVDAVLKPSGKPAAFEGLSWARMKDSQIVESWQYFDSAEVQREMRPPKEADQ